MINGFAIGIESTWLIRPYSLCSVGLVLQLDHINHFAYLCISMVATWFKCEPWDTRFGFVVKFVNSVQFSCEIVRWKGSHYENCWRCHSQNLACSILDQNALCCCFVPGFFPPFASLTYRNVWRCSLFSLTAVGVWKFSVSRRLIVLPEPRQSSPSSRVESPSTVLKRISDD